MKDFDEWSEVVIEEIESSPECKIGPAGHTWRLTIEPYTGDQLGVALTSDCERCDDEIIGPTGGEEIYLDGAITGKLIFEPEHEHLGGWHGLDTRCDCGWQWRFKPDNDQPETVTPRP